MAPERTDLVLTSDVPHRKADVLVFNSFDVESYTHTKNGEKREEKKGKKGKGENKHGLMYLKNIHKQIHPSKLHQRTDGWDCGHNFTELELVENGSLTSGIETNHEDAHLLLAKKAFKETSENVSHVEYEY